jgi:hypothetical protein
MLSDTGPIYLTIYNWSAKYLWNSQIFMVQGQIFVENYIHMVIVTHIWQKLSSVERDVTLIVKHFWQLFSRIFGETSLIVTHIWRNRFCFPYFDYIVYCRLRPLR